MGVGVKPDDASTTISSRLGIKLLILMFHKTATTRPSGQQQPLHSWQAIFIIICINHILITHD